MDHSKSSVVMILDRILDKIDYWNFPIFELDELTKGHALYFVALAIFHRRHFFTYFDIDPDAFRRFLLVIEANYQPNPYHNATHAADVLQTNHYMLLQALHSKVRDRCHVLSNDLFDPSAPSPPTP